MTDDVRKLLGGYAAGILTDEEKKALFEASLQDDALFAALADEQALKELLDDSAIRAQVLQATEDPRFTVLGALREWFEHPKSNALVATGAVLLALIGFNQVRQFQQPESTTSVAQLRRPAESRPQAPVPSAAPVTPEREQKKEATPVQTAAAPVTPPPPPASPAAAATAEKSSAAGEVGSVAGAGAGTAGTVATESLALEAPALRSADAVRSLRDSAPPSPQRAAAPAGAMQRAAGTSVTPLRYELLRRDAAGAFQAVPVDYVFAPGDVVRLRVTSSRDGAVGVSSNSASSVVSSPVIANTWTEVPRSGGITIAPDTERLVVAFAPSSTDSLTSNLLETDEARAKRAAAVPVSLEIPIRQKRP